MAVAADVMNRRQETLASIVAWNQACLGNDLNPLLRDFLLNSVSSIAKTGVWSARGQWRQFESFSADDIDPVHIHLYRSIPYASFWPELERSLLEGYSAAQLSDGYIRENPPFGGQTAEGRMMGDTCTAFVLAVLQLWRNGGCSASWLAGIYPSVKAATNWQLRRSAAHGLPSWLDTSYDWFGLATMEVASYAFVVFVLSIT